MKKYIRCFIFILFFGGVICGGLKLYRDINGDGIVYDYMQDTGVYGIRGGNTSNASDIAITESQDMYFVFCSSTNEGEGEIYETGCYRANLSESSYDWTLDYSYSDINVVGNTIYAVEESIATETLFSWDSESGERKVLREGAISKVMWANGLIYFVEGEKLLSINPETSEETLLLESSIGDYFFDNGKIYFTKGNISNLYSISVEGGTEMQINEYQGKGYFMYEGRIFYQGYYCGFEVLMSMNPDGTNNQIHRLWSANEFSAYDGKIYYINDAEEKEVSFIDLETKEYQEESLIKLESLKQILTTYYEEEIEKYTIQCAGVGDVVIINEIYNYSVADGYLVLKGGIVVDGWRIEETFIYDIEKKELTLVNEILGITISSDTYLRNGAERRSEKTFVDLIVKDRSELLDSYTIEEVALAEALLPEIVSEDMSEYEKVKTIYDYMIKNISYDYEALENNSADSSHSCEPIGALQGHPVVCHGYARTFELLCVLSDIDCIYVAGYSTNDRHAWNKVCIDGEWYNVDATWDDDGGYSNYTYFLVPDAEFEKNHKPYEEYLEHIPECTSNKYR